MDLTVLGNVGPYPLKGQATSGYLLQTKNKNVVLDMGSGVFSNLCKRLAPNSVNAIIISHTHFDHISDLGVFCYYLQFNSDKSAPKIKLYVPELQNPIINAQLYNTILSLRKGLITIIALHEINVIYHFPLLSTT